VLVLPPNFGMQWSAGSGFRMVAFIVFARVH
jgi:hypothetical protein